MANLGGFNANDVEPTGDFEAIPAGTYAAIMVESEMKDTKAGTGKYLECKFQIIDGPHKGRNVWDRLNLVNPNEKAVAIAKGTLSAICRATGVMLVNDSTDLHRIPISIKIACEKDNRDPDVIRNVIKSYKKRESATAQPSPSSDAPWAK